LFVVGVLLPLVDMRLKLLLRVFIAGDRLKQIPSSEFSDWLF
jgi:hypothetical protein